MPNLKIKILFCPKNIPLKNLTSRHIEQSNTLRRQEYKDKIYEKIYVGFKPN
jgi:hypothetical protein